jgi:hypothetical protein
MPQVPTFHLGSYARIVEMQFGNGTWIVLGLVIVIFLKCK